MDALNCALRKQEKLLMSIIEKAEESLLTAPDGYLKIGSGKRGSRYYHVNPANERDPKKCGTYIRKSEMNVAAALAQKSYDQRIIKAARNQLSVIRFALKHYDEQILQNQYSNMSEARRNLVSPYLADDRKYVELWESEKYIGNSFSENIPDFRTEKGERVRSKSEIIIADKLNKLGIPYKYEKPLVLDNGKTVYPDFTVLNVRRRKEYYFEYLGKMDDPVYVKRNMEKINMYEQSGIFPGEKLVLAFESGNQIDIWNLEALFKHYFL